MAKNVVETMSLEDKVRQLWDLREIESLLNRYCRAFDRCDVQAAQDTYWPDALDDHPGFCGDAAGMCLQADNVHLVNFDSTQHYITNNEIELDGDTAHVESYFFLAARLKGAFETVLVGGRYMRRLARREGEWRIAATVCVLDWGTNGDMLRDLMGVSSQSSRDGGDWVYHRPLQVTRPPFDQHVLLKDSQA
jgi:ketosteroid isomerase-like protein